jgi:hypothetical protein
MNMTNLNTGTSKTGSLGAISKTQEVKNIEKIVDELNRITKNVDNLQTNMLLEPRLERFTKDDSHQAIKKYDITINAVAPSAEVGKAVVQSIQEFERRGGRTGAFFNQ